MLETSGPQQVCCAQRGQMLWAARQWENFCVLRLGPGTFSPSDTILSLPLLGPWPWVPVSRKEADLLQSVSTPCSHRPPCSTILLVPIGALEFSDFWGMSVKDHLIWGQFWARHHRKRGSRRMEAFCPDSWCILPHWARWCESLRVNGNVLPTRFHPRMCSSILRADKHH